MPRRADQEEEQREGTVVAQAGRRAGGERRPSVEAYVQGLRPHHVTCQPRAIRKGPLPRRQVHDRDQERRIDERWPAPAGPAPTGRTQIARVAAAQLVPLPKKFESLNEVCSSREEVVEGKKIKILITPASSRRGLWTNRLSKNGFPLLALCADRLLSMHATSAASERNWSVWRHIFTKYRTRLGLTKGEMLVYIRGNSETILITDGDEFEQEISLQMLSEMLEGEEVE
jgi:hypothetical protein